ncbi:ankyrin repeat-containing domain protein [Aspergillus alliaceus]|uniref:Ankyrin repeat-containing domain protein n=1 Tax=Petromyces alliaceus TaxID=209559 RepID=A0A5N7CAX7_PETAA|nr:ankyrin repeat-containing domain protein [Aspergillus alliaceus]
MVTDKKAERIPLPAGAPRGFDSMLPSTALGIAPSKEHFIHVETSLKHRKRCSPSCQCQCHSRRANYQNQRWCWPVLGRLFLNYDSLPLPRKRKCDQKGCRSYTSRVHMVYHFPSWAWNRAIGVSFYGSTILGVGASLHIKVPRVIPLENSEAWSAAYGGNSTALKHWLSTLRYSPFDVQSDGASLVLHAIRGGRGSTVEFLVDFWDIGKGTKCDDLTVYYATLALEAAGTDQAHTKDQYTRSLCLIAASREGYNENITEPTLHQLVRDGLDISHHAMPWAINSYDTWQRTPLVIACQVGNLEAARMLIMRGASVDLPDLLGRTPLMWAVKHREHHTSSALAELLLDAGCNADVKDRFGHPAIGIAMQGSFPNGYSPCLRRLVKQTDVRALNKPADDPFRQNPLHWFACTASRSDPGTREILGLLLSAGARLDMPDVRGHIPLQRAIMRNNTVGFDLLRSAYEQTNAELYDGHAILCTAATNAGAEILRGLMDSCLMDTVDIDSLDERGENPVSIFRRRATVPEDMMAGLSRPTAEETMAFESLVQNIRCRILKERIGPCSS